MSLSLYLKCLLLSSIVPKMLAEERRGLWEKNHRGGIKNVGFEGYAGNFQVNKKDEHLIGPSPRIMCILESQRHDQVLRKVKVIWNH